ncbi:hypothetical protein V6B16_06200 [Salinimicrobium catena]|uniref:hypothetical protein n=1 Tax=Salinimicrobium catena TaxID=390640 RepID=UPI002FE4A2D1
MSKSKKIGELYRERFEDARLEPPKECWDAISAALPPEEEQNRRVMPLWLPLSGVAAALAFIFLLNVDRTNSVPSEPFVVSPETEKPAEIDKLQEETILRETEKNLPQEKMSGVVVSEKVEENEFSSQTPNSLETIITVSKLRQGSVMLKEATISSSQGGLWKTFPREKNMPESIFEAKEALLLAFSEEKKEKEPEPEKVSRFSISPKAGAIYADQMGSNENSPGGSGLTMTYGMNLEYRISDKIRLRTGYGKLDLQYRSQELNYDSAVDYGFVGRTGNLPRWEQASLEQEMAYVEIPVEMEFQVIEGKLGLNLIGGMSSFWLQENSMSLEGSGGSYEEGKAGNLRGLSFSTNLGVGLSYDLFRGMEWNMEPMFKYQWNTYTHDTNLRPYILGVYSGIRFQF